MSSKLRNIGSKYSNPLARMLMAIIAVLVMVPYEAAKTLSEKAYSGLAGAFRALIGFALGLAGGIAAGHYIGWTLGAPTLVWLLAGAGGFIGVMFYIWPVLWLVLLNPAWKLLDFIWEAIRDFARNHFKNLTQGFIRLLGRVFPFSGAAWGKVLGRERESWLDELLVGLSYITAVLGSGYLGFSIFTALAAGAAAAGLPVTAGWALAFVAAVVAFGFTTGLLAQLLKYGKVAFVGITGAAALVYALSASSRAAVAALGLSNGYNYAAYLLEFLLFTAYAFPLANIALSDGLRWLVETVKPLVEKVYDGEEKNYRRLFHSLVNIAVAICVGFLSLALGPMLALPYWAGIALSALAGLLSYLLVFKLIDMDGGNIILGLVVSGICAWQAFVHWLGAGLVFGVYGGIAAAVVAFAVSITVAFPLAYLAVKAVANPLLAGWLSQPLVAAHRFAWDKFKEMIRQVGHCYEYGYRDNTDGQRDYRQLFLHLSNIGTAAGAYFAAAALSSALGFGTAAFIVTAVTTTFLSYTLVGRLILKGSTELVGTVASLAGAFYVGSTVMAHGAPVWLAVAIAVAAAALVFFLIFPIAYILVRLVAQPLLTAWLKPLLAGLYDRVWSLFVIAWEQFLAVYRAIRDFVRPYWQAIARTWASIWQAIRQTWDSMRGRRS